MIVVLGTCPSALYPRIPWHPSAPTTRRLREMMGDGYRADDVYWMNLLDDPGATRAELRARGKEIYLSRGVAIGRNQVDLDFSVFVAQGQNPTLVRDIRYLLCGSEVVRALGHRALRERRSGLSLSEPPVLRWYQSVEGVTMAVLPHPSGRNRWYNDARNRRAAERFLRRSLEEERAR